MICCYQSFRVLVLIICFSLGFFVFGYEIGLLLVMIVGVDSNAFVVDFL